ncbi:MAG: UDP-3-O-(3-hydroxymyristoyl)glucosamine N-acyltransferase [Caulobacteraceae bacterium]|nr:UDP-3-O-(3-hydroxymyristoyl)glucosamine N-acyltransferase [Caulobacteraceae bacterium]
MPDPRFYETLDPASLEELAALAGAVLGDRRGPRGPFTQAAVLTHADAHGVSFFADHKYAEQLSRTSAGACFLAGRDAGLAPAHCAPLITPFPQAAYALAADRLHRPRVHEAESPRVHPSARMDDAVVLGQGVVVGPGATIGRGTRISAGAVIGPGVVIGRVGFVGANACIGFALIGDKVRIHAGALIGEPGFGAALGPGGVVDVPQLGRVIIADGVTVGAGSCIDRGAWEDTTIGENTKIDNLVQIAHNAVIGRDCLLAAYTGISGSVVVGDGCLFGGRAGVADHVTIGAGARIAAAAGVMKDVPPGESWGGSPGRPLKKWMRETAWLARSARRRSGGEDQP